MKQIDFNENIKITKKSKKKNKRKQSFGGNIVNKKLRSSNNNGFKKKKYTLIENIFQNDWRKTLVVFRFPTFGAFKKTLKN